MSLDEFLLIGVCQPNVACRANRTRSEVFASVCKPWPAQHLPNIRLLPLFLQPQFGISMDPVPERRLTCWYCREKLGKRFGLVPASISSFWVFRMVE
jgi:hypothetical protein